MIIPKMAVNFVSSMLFSFLAVYALFAFSCWSLDPGEWDGYVRAAAGTCWGIVAFIAFIERLDS